MLTPKPKRNFFAGLLALSCASCGAATGLDVASGVSNGASSGAGGAASPTPQGIVAAPCHAIASWTVYDGPDDAYASIAAVNAGVAGVLYWNDGPMGVRQLRFARLAFSTPSTLTAWLTLVEKPIMSQSGLVSFHGAFYAAWIDAQALVHVGRLGDAGLDTDTVVGTSPGVAGAALGMTGGGRLVVAWSDGVAPTTSLRVATSADGSAFGAPTTIASSTMLNAMSIAPAPEGAAIAWSARFSTPDHSELHVAIAGEDGAVVAADTALTHHPRYVYDVALVRAPERFVLATTDSRADIGTVPLYSTTVSLEGAYGGSDARLTHAGHHENIDALFDGASTVLAYDEYGDGSQLFVRQLDANGADLFGPLQVSNATYPESGCCTDTRNATVATDGNGRTLVLWTEKGARTGSFAAFGMKAALLDCASRP